MTKGWETQMLDTIKNAILYGKDFCEDTAENIKETVVNAVDCAKLHYRIVAKRNEVNALYAVLGKNLMRGTEESEAAINALCEKITKKEDILNSLLEQYRIVCGKVICPECGRFMSEKYTYCPYCGKRVSDTVEAPVSDISEEELTDVREIDEL